MAALEEALLGDCDCDFDFDCDMRGQDESNTAVHKYLVGSMNKLACSLTCVRISLTPLFGRSPNIRH